MADGTVRGTFDLNTEPSLRALRELKREGARTETQFRQMGTTMDRTAVSIDRSWGTAARAVGRHADRIEARVGKLEARVERFGRTRAQATVGLNGWERVNAQLSELEQRLDRLDRRRATPSVGIGGGFSNLAGGGGGGFSQAAGGAARGGGFGLGGKLALGAAALLPGVQGLGVGATALAGSASGAALGAGAVGLGGLGTFGVGGGLTAIAAKGTFETLKELEKLQKKYTAAVERYGAASKQAAVARETLNRADAKEPNAAVASKQVSLFRSQFRRETAPARASIFGAIGNIAVAGRTAGPSIAAATNRSAAASSRAATNFAGFLAGGQSQTTLAGLSMEFARDLPLVERSLEHVTSTVEHLSMAARPFFHEGVVWAERWTHAMSSNTANEARVQRTMHTLVQDTKDWGKLAGATFRTVRDIFNMGRPSGDSMVVSLTHTLDRWDSWIQRNPAKVERFFREAQTTTEGVAGALTSIVHLLSQAATALSPIFNRAMGLIRIVSALGPGITTLGAAAAYGAYGGFRGGGGGGGSRTGALLRTGLLGSPYRGGGVGAAAPGGGVMAVPLGGGRMLGGVSNVRPSMVASRAPGGGFIVGPAAARAAPSEIFAAANARDMGPFVGIASRQRGLSGVGSRIAGSRGVAALGGAAKTIGATVAIMGALEAAGRGGGPGAITQNFLSSASMGLIHPVDNSGSRGAGWASQFAAGIPQTMTPEATQAVLGRKIARDLNRSFSERKGFSEANFGELLGKNRTNSFAGGRLNPNAPNFMAEAGAALKRLEGTGGGHAANVTQEIKALRTAWQEAKAGADAYRKSRNAALDLTSEQHALTLGSHLQGAFGVETSHGRSKAGALGDVTGGALSAMRSMRESGRKVLGENTLAWARQLAKGNPELESVVHKLTDRIKGLWHSMGRDVQIVNGRILTGSKAEWEGIATAMSDPIEKARERMSASFTAIQQEAVGALVSMGFSRKSATAAVAGQEKGGRSAIETVGTAATGGGIAGRRNARGGVIPGRGLQDTVPVPGGLAAPGESWIANRHTMNDLSRATVAMYGLTAQQMIGGETRAHAMPMRYALGGASLAKSGVGAGALAGVRSGVRSVAEGILAQFPGLSVTSTTGGTHATNSLHYLGEAVDLAGGSAQMLAAAGWTGRKYGASLEEGIHNPNLSVKHGRNVSSSFWGEPTWAEHANHIHIGVLGGGGAQGAAIGGGGAAGRALRLKARRSGMRGVPGLLADAGIKAFTGGLSSKLNAKLGGMGGGAGGGAVGGSGGSPSANESLGRAMMLAGGWPASEWPALKALWTQESGWDANSVNKSSGAYGIPQALGHGHPFNLGDARSQIAWGLSYIRGRYGSPSGAEAHEKAYNWYSRGGSVPFAGWHAKGGDFETRGPTLFGAGEKGKERVSIRPLNSSATGGHHIEVNIHGGHFASEADVEKTAQKVAAKILDALDEVGAGESDRELLGR